MRRALGALLVTASLAALAAAEPPSDERQLRALLDEFLAGASRGDAAVHERFWDDDLVYTRSAGRRTDKAEILQGLRATEAPRPDAPRTDYSAEDVRVKLLGETAVVAFRLVGVSRGERSEYLNTGTFVKRDGLWRAVAWQATRVPLPEDDARRQAAAADQALHAALLAADVKALEALLDPGFVWVHSDGRRLSRSELLEQLASGRLRYTKLDTSNVAVSLYAETAVVRGDSIRQRGSRPASPGKADPEPFPIYYTLTLASVDGRWKAVAMHTSRPAPAPPSR